MRLHGLRLFGDDKSVTSCQETYCRLIVKICYPYGCYKLFQQLKNCNKSAFCCIYTCKNLTTCSKSANKRQQVVFARLVTSCQEVWNKLLTTCNKLVDIVRLVTRLFQQGCYNHDITILLRPCVVNLVTFLLYHVCIRLVRTTS